MKIDMWLIENPEIFISFSQPGVSDTDIKTNTTWPLLWGIESSQIHRTKK